MVAMSTSALVLGLITGVAFAADSALYRAAGLYECPELCSNTGPSPSNWTQFTSNNDLKWCKNQTMLLSLPLHIPLSDPSKHSIFRACVASETKDLPEKLQQRRDLTKRQTNSSSGDATEQVRFIQSNIKTTKPSYVNDVTAAIKELQAKYLEVPIGNRNQTMYFAKRGDFVAGVYVGGSIQKQDIAVTALQQLADRIAAQSDGPSQSTLLQLCGDQRNADYTMGVVADGRGGLESVFAAQQWVKTWAKGSCVTDVDGTSSAIPMAISYTDTNGLVRNGTTSMRIRRMLSPASHQASGSRRLEARADCTAIQVVDGDSCAALASRCGISPSDFTKYNPDSSLCSSLMAGQWVCCSAGTLPDMRPKPNPDGTCAVYEVQDNDYCAKIAASNSLTVDDLEDLNQNTWGWSGCESLWVGMRMCLSSGDPPMPAPLSNAVCGPQVPGTEQPTNGTALADLNQCPLKACCNVWGQCGTTEEFCIESSLGPPGTSEPGKNGCISNCGMDIVNNDEGPDEYITLGYFEAWNYDRECLNMDVTQMSKSISHVHFAFAGVTSSFGVTTAEVQEQFDKFKAMSGYHKVLAFGGWAASTESTSYWIFREGVKEGNRETLATNLANFINDNDMDGIDLDWEYPGAKDIPGIPSADPIDGPNYLALLKVLRSKLPDKTISIAAPASYWYLQNFPIAEMAKVVDYIVYMTYDLHGQWDYDSKWSMPGCDATSCLRSHINMTETINSLSMITKAGVPSKKIVIGVSSYGRSFEMTEAGCTGPMCGFTGPDSTAEKGRCTLTNGYISNAEIDEIMRQSSSGATAKRASSVQLFTDDDSQSQILVYNNTQWVAFMDDSNKLSRKNKWSGLNFKGTTDWAVDLATFTPGDNNPQCYLSKYCQSPGANDTAQQSAWRWDQLCTDGAWTAAVDDWKTTNGGGQTFTRAVSNFFHGTSGMDCDVLAGENGCHSFQLCIQGDDTGPAATFILNSFVSISNMLLNTYEGVEDSSDTLDGTGVMDTFVDTFAPKPEGDLALKIILDIVSFALTAATGPFFNNFLRNTKWWKDGSNKDHGDNLKDGSRAIIGFTFTTAKDAKAPEPATGAAMAAQLQVIVRHFKETLTTISTSTFDGSDKSVDILGTLMAHGKLLDAKPSGKLDMEDRMSRVFYATLIPILWRQKQWKPVLVDTGYSCDEDPDNLILPESGSKFCVDGKRYDIMRPDGSASECPSESAQHWGMSCHWKAAKAMDGFDDLNGSDWAGLKKDDIVNSILARQKAGWGNPSEAAQFPDMADSSTFEQLWDNIDKDTMVSAPGVIDIPTCSLDEFKENWLNTDNDYYSWPCNKP